MAANTSVAVPTDRATLGTPEGFFVSADSSGDPLGEGRAAAAASSLDPYSQSVGELCPKTPIWIVSDSDPTKRFPASCGSYSCECCAPKIARQKAAIMTHVAKRVDRPRLLTLTQLPVRDDGTLDFRNAREQVKDYMRRIRTEFDSFELAWAIERNPQETGYHAHGLQHGAYVPQKFLQERWGGRIVDIRAVRRPAAGIYTVKEAVKVAGYTVKGGTENFAGLQHHLSINGHRVMHTTRGFLLGRTSRETLQDMSAMLSEGSIESWHREFPTPNETTVMSAIKHQGEI